LFIHIKIKIVTILLPVDQQMDIGIVCSELTAFRNQSPPGACMVLIHALRNFPKESQEPKVIGCAPTTSGYESIASFREIMEGAEQCS